MLKVVLVEVVQGLPRTYPSWMALDSLGVVGSPPPSLKMSFVQAAPVGKSKLMLIASMWRLIFV